MARPVGRNAAGVGPQREEPESPQQTAAPRSAEAPAALQTIEERAELELGHSALAEGLEEPPLPLLGGRRELGASPTVRDTQGNAVRALGPALRVPDALAAAPSQVRLRPEQQGQWRQLFEGHGRSAGAVLSGTACAPGQASPSAPAQGGESPTGAQSSRGAAALAGTYDSYVRLGYAQRIEAAAQRGQSRVDEALARNAPEEARAAALEASATREAERAATQTRLSPGGRATSALLDRSMSPEERLVRTRARMTAEALRRGEPPPTEAMVLQRLANRAGSSNRVVTLTAGATRVLGPAVLAHAAASAVLRVADARPGEQGRVAAEELGAAAGAAVGATYGAAGAGAVLEAAGLGTLESSTLLATGVMGATALGSSAGAVAVGAVGAGLAVGAYDTVDFLSTDAPGVARERAEAALRRARTPGAAPGQAAEELLRRAELPR